MTRSGPAGPDSELLLPPLLDPGPSEEQGAPRAGFERPTRWIHKNSVAPAGPADGERLSGVHVEHLDSPELLELFVLAEAESVKEAPGSLVRSLGHCDEPSRQ